MKASRYSIKLALKANAHSAKYGINSIPYQQGVIQGYTDARQPDAMGEEIESFLNWAEANHWRYYPNAHLWETDDMEQSATTVELYERFVNKPVMPSSRYLCKCSPAAALPENQRERLQKMVLLELPNWSQERQRRILQSLNTAVSIDPCIADLIQDLWKHGIETLGCCCGHNLFPGFVNVGAESADKMLEMGYKPYPVGLNGTPVNTFYL